MTALQSSYLDQVMKWVSTISFLSAAVLLSSNIPESRYGFFIFLLGHIVGLVVFYRVREWSLIVQNGVFIAIDCWGIYRWFFTN